MLGVFGFDDEAVRFEPGHPRRKAGENIAAMVDGGAVLGGRWPDVRTILNDDAPLRRLPGPPLPPHIDDEERHSHLARWHYGSVTPCPMREATLDKGDAAHELAAAFPSPTLDPARVLCFVRA